MRDSTVWVYVFGLYNAWILLVLGSCCIEMYFSMCSTCAPAWYSLSGVLFWCGVDADERRDDEISNGRTRI